MKHRWRTGKTLAALVLVVLFAVPLQAGKQHTSADFLLVEHVDRLLVYNRYQQHSTPEEQKLITPFVPMKILDAAAKLNDDFTPCLKVEIQNRIFYLIKNDALDAQSKNKHGATRIVKNAVLLNDTVRLTASNLTLISPNQKRIHKLSKGKILERYFQDGKKTYVKLVGQHPEYGWVVFSDKKEKGYTILSKKEDSDSISPLSDAIIKRIQSKLLEANKALSNLFVYFNTETNTKKIPPQWRMVELEQQYVCILQPETYAEQYAESTRYLAGDIDNILLGTDYHAVGTPGKVAVVVK